MKIQASIKEWATKVLGYPVTTLNQIQNGQFIIKMLHNIQPSSFRQDWVINQRSSNSLNNIMNQIGSYYKKELGQNISNIIDNINVFKSVTQVWELLVGIAVKGKNRDYNINIILQMEQELQSQLMSFVQQIIQKFGEYVYEQNLSNNSGQNNRKRSSSIQQFNQTNQLLAELMEQVETLKQKNIELITELDVIKYTNEQAKKGYESRIQKYKNERYDFLQVITNYNGQSKSKILGSSVSNDSDQFCFSVTGSLPQIACDLLNVLKQQKKQNNRQIQKINLLQQINKDLKQAYHRMSDQNNNLANQLKNNSALQQQLQKLRQENISMSKSENDLIKKIGQIEQQKFFLREIIQKNKIENQNKIKNQSSAALKNQNGNDSMILQSQSGVQAKKQANLDFLKIPKTLTNNLSRISQSGDGQYLSKQIDEIRQPLIRSKLQKQIKYLKQSIQQLKGQNQSLKSINSILQDAIHQSIKKTIEINDSLNQQFSKFLVEADYKSNQVSSFNNQLKQVINQNEDSQVQVQQEQLPQIKFTIKVSYEQKQVSSQEFIIQDKQLSPRKLNNNSQNDILYKRDGSSPQKSNKSSKKQNESSKNQRISTQKQKRSSLNQNYLPASQNLKETDTISGLSNQQQIKTEGLKQQNQLIKKNRYNNHQSLKLLFMKMRQIIEKYQNKELVLRIQIQSLKKQIQLLRNQEYNQRQNASKIQNVQNRNMQSQSTQNIPIINVTRQVQSNKIIQNSMGNFKKSEYKLIYNYQIEPKKDTQFIQIKQGEDLNQNQLPASLRNQMKSQFFNMNSQVVHDMVQKNVQKSTLQFLRPIRASRYNESFMQLNNRLQSELQTEVQNLMIGLQPKQSNLKTNNQNMEKDTETFLKKQKLIQKLNQIKNSTAKLSLMYQQYINQKSKRANNETYDLISELQKIGASKTRLQNQQVVSLKILNQGLKMLVNQMLGQKQATYNLVLELKASLLKPSLSEQTILSLFSDLQCLQHMKFGPQLQKIMKNVIQCEKQSKQKTEFYEKLYQCERQKNQSLQIQITLLMESIVIFRNMALDD